MTPKYVAVKVLLPEWESFLIRELAALKLRQPSEQARLPREPHPNNRCNQPVICQKHRF